MYSIDISSASAIKGVINPPILATALAMPCPVVRIWVGNASGVASHVVLEAPIMKALANIAKMVNNVLDMLPADRKTIAEHRRYKIIWVFLRPSYKRKEAQLALIKCRIHQLDSTYSVNNGNRHKYTKDFRNSSEEYTSIVKRTTNWCFKDTRK